VNWNVRIDPATKLLLRHNILSMIYEARLGCLRAAHTVSAQRRPGGRMPTVNGRWSVTKPAAQSNVDAGDDATAAHRSQNCPAADDDGELAPPIKEDTD